jgi:hypothetical protein
MFAAAISRGARSLRDGWAWGNQLQVWIPGILEAVPSLGIPLYRGTRV